MQIVITLSDSDSRSEAAALLSHLHSFYSVSGAPALSAAEAVETGATDAANEAPKTPRKPRAAKVDPVAAYNAIAAAAGAPVVEEAAPIARSASFDVITDPAPVVVTTPLQASFDAEAAAVEAEIAAAATPAAPAPLLTIEEKRAEVRSAIMARGLAKAVADFNIPRGAPPIPQWSDAEVERVYALATAP